METPKTRTEDEMSYRSKIITSCSIWFCTFALGLSVNFIPPYLLELSSKYQTDISTISLIFTIITLSFLVGAIASGFLFNFVNRQLASALLFIGLGIATICVPFCPSLTTFFITGSVIGITAAGYDTAQIVWIIEMWKDGAAVYIQIQHFCFALGTLISPLIVKPFLAPEPEKLEITLPNFVGIMENSTESVSEVLLYNTTVDENADKTPALNSPLMHVPFVIGGSIAILGGIGILLLFQFSRYRSPRKSSSEEDTFEKGATKTKKIGHCNSRKFLLVGLSAAFLGVYQGMEMCTNQFLPTFTHFIQLGLTKREGALILSGLSGAFTVGRGIGILIVLRVLPQYLLLGNLILIILGNASLLLLSNNSLPFLWAASITLGMGFSTVFPAFYGYIEKHLKISNVIGAVMIVAGGFVSALYPIVIGHAIEKHPFVLMYTNFFSITIGTISFVIIYLMSTLGKGRSYEIPGESESDYARKEKLKAKAASERPLKS